VYVCVNALLCVQAVWRAFVLLDTMRAFAALALAGRFSLDGGCSYKWYALCARV